MAKGISAPAGFGIKPLFPIIAWLWLKNDHHLLEIPDQQQKLFFGPSLSIKCCGSVLSGIGTVCRQAGKHTNRGEKLNLFGRGNHKSHPFCKRISFAQWCLSVFSKTNQVQQLKLFPQLFFSISYHF